MELLQDAAATLVALAGVATSVGVLSRLRPVRWLWRQVIAKPLGRWFRGEVTEVAEGVVAPIRTELSPNGGHSLGDAVRRTEAKVDRLGERQDATDERLAVVEARTEGCPGRDQRS